MINLSKPSISEEEIEAVAEVLRSGNLVQGEKVKKFEEQLAAYIGAPYVVTVTSGTAALHLALISLGIGPGDAVFVPAFTFPATVNVVEIVGARPVFVDVDPDSYCLSTEALKHAIAGWKGSERPKAVIPVHEFGAPSDMDGIIDIVEQEGLYLIEDAACALGTRYRQQHVGKMGKLGCFSFHPRKAITTGEGGALATDDIHLYQLLLKLRNHGISRSDDGVIDFDLPGYNYRMTEFQAVLGLHQLKRFDVMLNKRRAIAEEYVKELSSIDGMRLPKLVQGHAWQTFMLKLPRTMDRNLVIDRLKRNGIETNLGAQALHMLRYYKNKYHYQPDHYPIAAQLYQQGLAIPIHAEMNMTDLHKVIRVLHSLKS